MTLMVRDSRWCIAASIPRSDGECRVAEAAAFRHNLKLSVSNGLELLFPRLFEVRFANAIPFVELPIGRNHLESHSVSIFCPQMNGSVDPQAQGGPSTQPQKPTSDYKLLVDPLLQKAPAKVYRHNGIPTDPTFPPVLVVKDPRNITALRLRQRLEPIELPVPR